MIDGFEMVFRQVVAMTDDAVDADFFVQFYRLDGLLRLYLAYPAPPRKIRKCQRRKLQARWRKGRARIERRTEAYRKRWEAA